MPRRGGFHTGSPTWRRVRKRVLERDNFECQLRLPGCRRRADQVDHMVPRHLGGAWYDEMNCRASCGHCNKAKGNYDRRRSVVPPSREW